MELLQTLGIEPKLLLAQIVNFAILLLILWKVAYKPLLSIMKDRSERIEKSLHDAEALQKERAAWAQEHERLVASAKQETRQMVIEAKEQAEQLRVHMKEQVEQEMALSRKNVAHELKLQEERAMKALEERVVSLVAGVAQNFLSEKMTGKDDEKLIQKLFSTSK